MGEQMSFVDDLKAQFEAPRDFINVSVRLSGNVHTFRITQMDPEEWVVATRMKGMQARLTFPLDMQFGYNLDALTPVVLATSAKRVEGDELVDMTPDQWTNLLKAISGGERGKLSNAIFELNEVGPLEEIEELKKALRALSEQGSDLPANLESPTAD